MADEVWKVGDVGCAGYVEAVAEIIPERDALLGAGLHEAEEGIAAVAAGLGSGAAGDLALGDLTCMGRPCVARAIL